jgi:hypothetical protein
MSFHTSPPASRRAFLRASCFAAGAAAVSPSLLAGCATKPSAAAAGFPAIVDTSSRLTAAQAAGLRAAGAKTVFRYYCHLPASIPGKDLEPEEAKIILGAGLSLAVVFQHYNNCFLTFENRWGREDALRALEQAHAIGQPKGSAIYFGADGDWPYESTLELVVAYFEDVAHVLEGSGYDLGIYSNGCLCNAIAERKLASYFWLSGSTAHTGTQAFYNQGRWSLYQNSLDVRVGDGTAGVALDTSVANAATKGYFGQFDAKGARSAAHALGDTQAILGARRFLKTSADLKSEPDGGAKTLASLKKDQNVRVTAIAGPWVRVLTQEGGTRSGAGGAPVEGWAPSSALTPMDRFGDGTTAYGLCGSAETMPAAQKQASCAGVTSRAR